MKLVKIPTGEIYKLDDCRIFNSDSCNPEDFFHTENQKELAKELFENTGILVGKLKGGGNTE